jgi:hypothetical protein
VRVEANWARGASYPEDIFTFAQDIDYFLRTGKVIRIFQSRARGLTTGTSAIYLVQFNYNAYTVWL